jgi:hypothetical protein
MRNSGPEIIENSGRPKSPCRRSFLRRRAALQPVPTLQQRAGENSQFNAARRGVFSFQAAIPRFSNNRNGLISLEGLLTPNQRDSGISKENRRHEPVASRWHRVGSLSSASDPESGSRSCGCRSRRLAGAQGVKSGRCGQGTEHRLGVWQRDAADDMDDRVVRCCCAHRIPLRSTQLGAHYDSRSRPTRRLACPRSDAPR